MIINKITYEHKQSSIHAVAAHTRERAESPRKKPRAAHNKLCMTSIRYHFTFISLRWGLSTRKSRVFLPSGGEKEAEKKCSQLRNNIVNRENLSRLTFFSILNATLIPREGCAPSIWWKHMRKGLRDGKSDFRAKDSKQQFVIQPLRALEVSALRKLCAASTFENVYSHVRGLSLNVAESRAQSCRRCGERKLEVYLRFSFAALRFLWKLFL
jgi:hypothetical protein